MVVALKVIVEGLRFDYLHVWLSCNWRWSLDEVGKARLSFVYPKWGGDFANLLATLESLLLLHVTQLINLCVSLGDRP